uniref:uncharacterized protein isoform X1 n=2 Tax=Pristiophorus japonicus TaxID=55135 RepID=UPI00398E9719
MLLPEHEMALKEALREILITSIGLKEMAGKMALDEAFGVIPQHALIRLKEMAGKMALEKAFAEILNTSIEFIKMAGKMALKEALREILITSIGLKEMAGKMALDEAFGVIPQHALIRLKEMAGKMALEEALREILITSIGFKEMAGKMALEKAFAVILNTLIGFIKMAGKDAEVPRVINSPKSGRGLTRGNNLSLAKKPIIQLLMILVISNRSAGVDVIAEVGKDVMLPCSCEPGGIDKSQIYWQFGELVVWYYKQGAEIPKYQSEQYRGRTRIFSEELLNGNLSLQILRPQLNDSGVYKCIILKPTETPNSFNVRLILSEPEVESGVITHPWVLANTTQTNITDVGHQTRHRYVLIGAAVVVFIHITILVIYQNIKVGGCE